jgi:hypothetical protein
MKKSQLNVYIPIETIQMINELAVARDVKVSDLVNLTFQRAYRSFKLRQTSNQTVNLDDLSKQGQGEAAA